MEKAIFSHDDRSVRPIVLVTDDGAARITLFNFKDINFSEESIKKTMPSSDPLKTTIDIDLSFFENVPASDINFTNKFILVPSSELTFNMTDSDEVQFNQNYQVLIQSKKMSNIIEIHEF